MNDEASRAGTQFGPYELMKLLGRGGMGEVYQARDTVKDRVVAVKLLPRELSQDERYRERFRREAQVAARLQDPHVVPIHDFGEIDGVLFIDMALVPGRDLHSLLRERGALPPSAAVGLVEQVASAVDAAHASGLLHRDIKPENILVTDKQFAYLADFGIAAESDQTRLTTQGGAIGSLAYMAPERFDDQQLTPGVDVYALTCVFYECLTGEVPYRGSTAGSLIKAHMLNDVPTVSDRGLSPALDEILAIGMAKEPSGRFRDAGALARAARAALTAPIRHSAATTTAGAGATAVGSSAVSPGGAHDTPTRAVDHDAVPTHAWHPGQPLGGPPVGAPQSTPQGDGRRSPGGGGKIAAAVLALALLVGGGLFAGLKLGGKDKDAAPAGTTAGAGQSPEQGGQATVPGSAGESQPSSTGEEGGTSDEGSPSSSAQPAPSGPPAPVTQYLNLMDTSSSEEPESQDGTVNVGGTSLSHVIAMYFCGSHTSTTISYALNGSWDKLTAKVGLDDASDEPKHTGLVTITVDGVQKWKKQVKRGPAQPMSVPVTGANDLQITVSQDVCNSDTSYSTASAVLGEATLHGTSGKAPSPTSTE